MTKTQKKRRGRPPKRYQAENELMPVIETKKKRDEDLYIELSMLKEDLKRALEENANLKDQYENENKRLVEINKKLYFIIGKMVVGEED